jgi:subtilisin family serine protease
MEPPIITINGNVVLPAAQREGGRHFAPDASKTNYIIIQALAQLDPAQLDLLDRLGVCFQQYLVAETFICRYGPTDLTELRALPFLHFVNPYHPDYVVVDALKRTRKLEKLHVYILPHEDLETAAALEALIQKIARLLDTSAADILRQTDRLQMWLEPHQLGAVAALDEVWAIAEVPTLATQMWTARTDTGVRLPTEYPPAIGLDGYTAASELIAIADSGITVDHPAFMVRGPNRTASKITAESWRTVVPGANTVNDVRAHGTHVAGCAAGVWDSPAMASTVRGSAPNAKVFFQVIFELNGAGVTYPAGQDFRTLIDHADKVGAKIHNNSYVTTIEADVNGEFHQPTYSPLAMDVDKAAWKYRHLRLSWNFANRA